MWNNSVITVKHDDALRLMYIHEVEEGHDNITSRELTRKNINREPTNEEANATYMALRRLEKRGFVRVERDNGKKKGGTSKYWLSESGRSIARLVYYSEYYCNECSEFKDEDEVVHKPSCPDCGEVVYRKEK